jgi:hypothetical protein
MMDAIIAEAVRLAVLAERKRVVWLFTNGSRKYVDLYGDEMTAVLAAIESGAQDVDDSWQDNEGKIGEIS